MAKGGIIGFGHYAPDRAVTNSEIEADLGVEPGWIERRTGIKSRRYAAPDQALTDIAIPAAKMALENAGIDRAKIGLTLLATSTPDHLLPPSSPLLTHKLGLSNSGAIDMAGACAGFLYALSLADAYSRTHGITVLIVAANILSRRINPQERASRVLFADAAGAVVVAPPQHPGQGVLGVDLAADGTHYDLIKIEAGGSRQPINSALHGSDLLMSISDGQAVFSKAVTTLSQSGEKALERAGISSAEITSWAPHQANMRIIRAVGSNLDIAESKTLITLDEFGNSSAATIPFTLSRHQSGQKYTNGDRLLLSAIGAGFISGSVVYGM